MFKKVFSKNENKILLMLAFFSISIGLWNNCFKIFNTKK